MRWAVLALAVLGALRPVTAQTVRTGAADDVAVAVRAYDELEFSRAVQLLRHALAGGAARLDSTTHTRVETYLGAAEVLHGRPDSAAAVFGRLLRRDPRVRLDALVFPPEVTELFDAVRRRVRAVHAIVPDEAVLSGPADAWTLLLLASAPHDIRVVIRSGDGTVARAVYAGATGDSMPLTWDGMDDGGVALSTGAYRLVVLSLDERGTVEREFHVPLRVHARAPDTMPHPVPPVLRPERGTAGAMVEALVGGLGVGLALWLGPPIVVGDVGWGPGRLVLAGGISLTGVLGALVQRPGRLIPGNAQWNREMVATWEGRLRDVAVLNAERRRHPPLHITAGAPTVVQVRAP